MALPPTIPTSFVPHPGSKMPESPRTRFTNAFGVFSYGIVVLAVVLAIAVFLYGLFLNSRKEAKDQELAAAQSAIDPATVENFVRLKNRLNLSRSLLEGHAAFSEFFRAFEAMLPASVRFSSLHVSAEENDVVLEGVGTAKSFNALAATSNAFGSDGRIKDAIFSNISVNKDNTVSFSLSAKLSPKIFEFSPSAPAPIAPASEPIETTTP